MKAKNVQEYLGTLQQTVVTSWRKHLKSEKHSEHVILNDFYDDMLDAVDELTEAYQAQNEKVENYVNLFDKTKKMTALEYVQAIYDFTKENRDIVGDSSEIQSLVDDILSVCDTAIYKLKDLVESNYMDLKDFLTESLVTEKRMSAEAKMISKSTIDMLKKVNASYSDINKIKVQSTADPEKWKVWYDNKYVDEFNVFPPDFIDVDSIFNVAKELNWMK